MTSTDSRRTAAATLFAAAMLIVDDAHCGDAPSLRFLDFLARRRRAATCAHPGRRAAAGGR